VRSHVKPQQVRIENLRRVIQAAALAREQEPIAPALVLDVDPPFLDVDVRRPVLSHRAQLHDVRMRNALNHGPDHVEGGADVVVKRESRLLVSHHRVRRRWLLGVMDDGLGLEFAERTIHERTIGTVADLDLQGPTGDRGERLRPDGQIGRGDERLGSRLTRQPTAEVVVDDHDVIAESGEAHGRRPAEIAVTAKNQNPHASPPTFRPGAPQCISPR